MPVPKAVKIVRWGLGLLWQQNPGSPVRFLHPSSILCLQVNQWRNRWKDSQLQSFTVQATAWAQNLSLAFTSSGWSPGLEIFQLAMEGVDSEWGEGEDDEEEGEGGELSMNFWDME